MSDTYKDCPIADYTRTSESTSYFVAAHNPATVSQDLVRFKQMPLNVGETLSVTMYDYKAKTWNPVQSDLHCYSYYENKRQLSSFEDCDLYVQGNVQAHRVAFFEVETIKDDTEQIDSTSKTKTDYSDQNDTLTIKTSTQQLDFDGKSFKYTN